MKYLLDSNICIYFLRNKAEVVSKFMEAGLENCYISEYTVAELFYGAECSDRPKANSQDIIEFCSALNVIPITKEVFVLRGTSNMKTELYGRLTYLWGLAPLLASILCR